MKLFLNLNTLMIRGYWILDGQTKFRNVCICEPDNKNVYIVLRIYKYFLLCETALQDKLLVYDILCLGIDA